MKEKTNKTLKEIERKINFLLEDQAMFGLTKSEEDLLFNLQKLKRKLKNEK